MAGASLTPDIPSSIGLATSLITGKKSEGAICYMSILAPRCSNGTLLQEMNSS